MSVQGQPYLAGCPECGRVMFYDHEPGIISCLGLPPNEHEPEPYWILPVQAWKTPRVVGKAI